MSEITFRSDIRVQACLMSGGDGDIARGGWAVLPGIHKNDNPAGWAHVIAACMKDRHNSPFEHGLMQVYTEAPGVVWWQLTRQRFMSLDSEDFSFSMESGRYKHLDPEFYLPSFDRPCLEPVGFKPMRPVHEMDAQANFSAEKAIRYAVQVAWTAYQEAINCGVAREVVRLCLPNWALYCDGYVTGKPLTWLQFFSKRNKTADTAVPTFPQWEIEEFARRCEELFAAQWPLTHAAFVKNGRVAP